MRANSQFDSSRHAYGCRAFIVQWALAALVRACLEIQGWHCQLLHRIRTLAAYAQPPQIFSSGLIGYLCAGLRDYF
ncbi:uncharacterized protein EI90DRAFT_3074919 [Cantharellus anzutake]|uniref:uncharacterized protein n=1 Tax=Cantharellus anzutake TaxID=1750568 RepID=UPI001903CA77|nr:uncharacterized protein EI90DRAFT_3074919 [Cantharellus anzutake]KAF8324723.1 hypothetical protein EI90DRAFT_3074919 [Cantharellus anzutake]